MNRTRSGALWLTLALAGCILAPDSALWQSRNDARVDARRDAGRRDGPGQRDLRGEGPRDGVAGDWTACSATGVPTKCDPLALTGCGAGSCYLLAKEGLSCVCPAGTVAIGQSCNATKECKPGHVCAGWTAPGTCREVCNPKAAACPGGTKCRYLSSYPDWGYCEPTD